MCSPDLPEPPDPRETASAQTSTNVGTAIANSLLGAVNQNTPNGSLTYDIQGWQQPTAPTATPAAQPVAPSSQPLTHPDDSGNVPRTSPNHRASPTSAPPPNPRAPSPQSGGYQITDPTSGAVYAIPRITANVTLSPEQQRIHDLNQQAQRSLAGTAATQADFLQGYMSEGLSQSSLPSRGELPQGANLRDAGAARNMRTGFGGGGDITRSYGGDFAEQRRDVEDAIYSRLDPKLKQDRASLEARLANQGIVPGSEAYKREIRLSDQGANDARMQAILAGGQEQSRLTGLEAQRAGFENSAQGQAFNQSHTGAQFANNANQQNFNNDMTRTGFNNQTSQSEFGNDMALFNAQNGARNQAMQEDFGYRNQPINEISALLSRSQVTSPNVTMAQPSSIPTVDYAGLVNQNHQQQVQNAQAQSSWGQNILGGLFGLGSSAITGGLL